jgi:hypothetical protein
MVEHLHPKHLKTFRPESEVGPFVEIKVGPFVKDERGYWIAEVSAKREVDGTVFHARMAMDKAFHQRKRPEQRNLLFLGWQMIIANLESQSRAHPASVQ